METGIHGPLDRSGFQEGNRDPRTVKSVWILKEGNWDPRTAYLVRILKEGNIDPWTA